MATKKQRHANRRNAKHSTGPKTADGKAKVHTNALRHGLMSKTVHVMPWESPEEYQAHREECWEYYDPQTPLEKDLVERLIINIWRLRRIDVFETMAMTQSGMDNVAGHIQDITLKLSRYEARISKTIKTCREELRELQGSRLRYEYEEQKKAEAAQAFEIDTEPSEPPVLSAETLLAALPALSDEDAERLITDLFDAIEARQQLLSGQNGFEWPTPSNPMPPSRPSQA